MKTTATLCLLGLLLATTPACPHRRVYKRHNRVQRSPSADLARFAALAKHSQQLLWQQQPGRATALGLRRFARRLPEREGSALKDMVEQYTQAVQSLYALPAPSLNRQQRVDRQRLIAELRLQIYRVAVEARPLFAPTDDLNILQNLIMAIWLDAAQPLPPRLGALADMLVGVPLFLDASRRNLHRPDRRLCELALSRGQQIQRFLDRDLRALGDRAEAALRDRLDLAVDEAVHGLRQYRQALQPRCQTASDQAIIGAPHYRIRLQLEHGLTMQAADVVELAQRWLKRSRTALLELADEPKLSPAPLSTEALDRQTLRSRLQQQIDHLRGVMQAQHLISIAGPVPAIRVIEVPSLMRASVPELSLLSPPTFGRVEPLLLSGLVSRQALDPQDQRDLLKALSSNLLMLHLAAQTYPGRFLLKQLVRKQTRSVRRVQQSVMLDQGWALYAAGLAIKHGLVAASPSAKRAYWELVRNAAARALVDASLHSGAMSWQAALSFLRERTSLPGLATISGPRAPWLEQDLLSMLQQPTRAAAPLLGLQAIIDMRKRVEAFEGMRFDARTFHDRLLGQGELPPPYIAHLIFRDPMPALDPFTAPVTQSNRSATTPP